MFSEIIPKLNIYINEDFEPLIFSLKIGKYKIGSESSCEIRLPFNEIDTLHGIITVYENGECTYESVSLNFNDHRYFQIPFDSQKIKVPIRKNKEIDLTHEMVFFISKFKVIFEYEKINSNESLESDEKTKEIEQNNNHLKIKNIFRRSFEKIKMDIKQRNDPKMKFAFAKFNEEFHNSQDAFSKFESLYESFKPLFNKEKSEETISTQNLSTFSLMLSTEEKSRKKIHFFEKDLMNEEERELKIIDEEDDIELTAKKNSKNVILSNFVDQLNDKLPKLTYQECEDERKENSRNKNNEESQIIDNLAGLMNIDAIHEKFIKSQNLENIQESEVLGATILQNLNLEHLDPTILQSQNAEGLEKVEQMDPTMLQSQHAENLDDTLPQSQIKLNESFLEPTLPQQEANNLGNSLGPTLAQVNDNLGSTFPQENNSISQGNKQRKKVVKPSAKKTKIERSDEKLKNEKRIKFEKIMLEEKINSLKLFTKDTIDDLEDLFDKPILNNAISKESEKTMKNNDPYSFSSPNHISKEKNSDFALNSFKKEYITSPTNIIRENEEKNKIKKTNKNPAKDKKDQKGIGFLLLKRTKTAKQTNSSEENIIKEKAAIKNNEDCEGENIYQISQTQNNIPDDKTEKLSSNDSREENSEIIKMSKIPPRRAKINKTLTQLFTNENNQDFSPELVIAISVKKLKKTQIKLLNEMKIKVVEDVTEDENIIIEALVADELSTKPKIIICINKGIRIISEKWIDDVLNQKKIIKNFEEYEIKDENFENKYKINLKESLKLAKLHNGFLKGYNIFIHDIKFSLNNKMLEKIIISAKGNLIHSMPSKGTEKHLVLVDLKNQRLIQSLVDDNIRFLTKENLTEFCLRQTFD